VPLLILLILALTVGVTIGSLAWRFSPAVASLPPALESARKVGETIGRHRSLRRALEARLDPAAATGLALTLALLVVTGGGLLFALLAYLVRSNAYLHGVDNSVAKWGDAHASALSTDGLNVVTQLGGIYLVVALCVLLAVGETLIERSAWVIPFVVTVIAGEEILALTVKDLAERVRPAFNPAAATLGPSFPSGHSATAAAFYACAALLIGRRRGRATRAALAGLAVGLAVAVAASRVLLDVHWLTDVIAGLALGWAWFSVCAIAFGGRMLRFGAAAETAARAARATAREAPRPRAPQPDRHVRAHRRNHVQRAGRAQPPGDAQAVGAPRR
jgi:membrane-associated phospholipid phosphatase